MPIYTFVCNNEDCGEVVEIFGSVTKDYRAKENEMKCPECEEGILVKKLDNPPFKFAMRHPLQIRKGELES